MSRLQDEIEKYQEGFRQRAPQAVQETMLLATQQLKDAVLSKNALQVGANAKDFDLPNGSGDTITLEKVLEENDFVVISFYRGLWCPYCNLELKALEEKYEEFKALGAEVLAISPQSPDATISTQEKNKLSFEVLSDTNNRVAKKYGLVFSLAEELRPIYKSFGIDIPQSNNEDSYEIPMPATYVINKNKEIIFAFIDEDYTQRSEPQAILDAIKK